MGVRFVVNKRIRFESSLDDRLRWSMGAAGSRGQPPRVFSVEELKR